MGMLISSMVIFGTIGLFRRLIPLPSGVIAMSRGLIGAALLWLLLRLRGGRLKLKSMQGQGLWLLLSGAILGVNWILLFEAYRYTSVAVATLCYYMAPILVILVSPLLFRERITRRKWICTALAVAGMLLVSGVLNGDTAGDLRGVLFGLGAAALYACVMLLNKRITGVDGLQKTIVQLLTAGVVLIPYVLLTEDVAAADFTPGALGMLLVVGVVHTALTYGLYFGSIEDLRMQTVALLGYLDPVVAVLTSALLLREPMSALQIIGTILVLGAAVLSALNENTERSKQPC
ncbi:MAG: EamA family transporter [Oscillospiraceae bacterium]|nr:EamA family transporter [Oscillospiraceae bacterium]